MMQITITLNGTKISPEIEPDTLLIDLVRSQGCYSVKRGCETANCGLCTVFLDEKPVLSCSVAGGAGGRSQRDDAGKDSRRRQKNLAHSLPIREPNSAASVIRALS